VNDDAKIVFAHIFVKEMDRFISNQYRNDLRHIPHIY